MDTPILMMARELHLGGSERQMTEIGIAIRRAGFAVHVGCFRPSGLRYDELRAAGVPVVQFPIYSYASFSALTGLAQLVWYVRRQRIQIVHAWDYPTAVSVIPATRLFTSAIAISSQRGHRDLVPGRYRRLTRISDLFAHAVVVNCAYLRRHITEDERVPEQKIRVCFNGVDTERIRRIQGPKPTPLQRAPLVIGTVCSLRPEKQLTTLIDAFAGVRRALPGLMLVIVGSGPELRRLQEHAVDAGVRAACHFEPATADVAHWLSAMDVFVLPSRTEAFSNALLEAMACGCCVIATNVGGNPELVRNGENGLLFPPGGVEALTALLQGVIDNPGLRARLAGEGERHVRKQFGIESAAHAMAEVYSEFLDGSPDT